MKEYELIKGFISILLFKSQDMNNKSLTASEIDNQIFNVKKLWDSNKPLLCSLLNCNVVDLEFLPTDDDFVRMKKEFEARFNVDLPQGTMLQGESSKKRNTSWWTNGTKLNGPNYYSERNRRYLVEQDKLANQVIRTIDIDTDNILDNIENPRTDSFDIHGMVVGHVQSGKTGNYTNLICKAADAGYKFIVVVAGGTKILRNQTQERINNDFIGYSDGLEIGVGLISNEKSKQPISLTTLEADFNIDDARRAAQAWNFDTNNTPLVLVIQKNTRTLSNVIDWLEKQYKNGITNHAMLLIDDESDYASIDTSKDEDYDPSTINRKLRKLLSLFSRKSYIAYTATPYANVFIDDEAIHEKEKDLFPKDFIYALDAPTNYFGAEKIFLENRGKYLVAIDDFQDLLPLYHKINFSVIKLPNSMKEAINTYLINIAIRRLRGQYSSHNSMLIHVSRFTDIHQQISSLVDEHLSLLKNDIYAYGKLSNSLEKSGLIKNIFDTYNDHIVENKPKWLSIINELNKFLSQVAVREVHGKVKENKLEYTNTKPTYAIVVGGQSLSRGFTIEGLTVSYFLRTTKFYDTLMQMGRWFGYRVGYEDLCRIYTTETMMDNFVEIISATKDLFDDFKEMAELKRTPKDFGLCVKEHPKSLLQVTAKNKLRNTEDIILQLNLDGREVETSWLSNSSHVNNQNIVAVQELLIDLLGSQSQYKKVGNHYLWQSVKNDYVLKFLNNFETYPPKKEQESILSITTKMPIRFVLEYTNENKFDWDVAIFSGSGEEFHFDEIDIKLQKRKFKDKSSYLEVGNRQVSSGDSESLPLSQETRKGIGSNGKRARALRNKPLLMLHLIEPDIESIDKVSLDFTPLAAFGISFNGSPIDREKTVRVKANKVLIKNIRRDMVNDAEE